MHKLLLLFLLPIFVIAAELHLPVQTVSDSGENATVNVKQIAKGVHGFVVRHFTGDHSVIVADTYIRL